MNQPNPDAAIAEVETAIEEGRLADARSALGAAVRRFGATPALGELEERLVVVEKITLAPQVEALVKEAQEEVVHARYPEALGKLRRAAELRPGDPGVVELLERTEKAAARHREALDRHRSVLDRAGEISRLLDRGELQEARAGLREAGISFGKHTALSALGRRLEQLEEEAQRRRIGEMIDHARLLLDRRNHRGALQELERVLRLQPEHGPARELHERTRAELEEKEAERHRRDAVEAARRDVERLIAARELERASRQLDAAVATLGPEKVFDELRKKIARSGADHRFRQRIEWAERRANEAERLIEEAAKLSLKGDYRTAIERLSSARELDPSHPEIETKLATATAARERQLGERRRAEALAARVAEIRSLLDRLHLDEAEKRLRAAAAEYGPRESFTTLGTRLERLREVERAGATPAADLDPRSEALALERQRALAAAYSWKQTFLFPFRGAAGTVFAAGVAVLVALEVASLLPAVGWLFALLRGLLPLLAAGGVLAVVASTAAGKNQLPPSSELLRPGRFLLHLALLLAVAAIAAAPLLLWLWSRSWHGLTDVAAGWLAAALLGWLATAAGVLAAGAAGTFGEPQAPRLDRHLRALGAAGSDLLLAVDAVFLLLLGRLLAASVVTPFNPWFGTLLAAALELYVLLLAPHLVGVAVRRHRLELSRVYG